MFTSTEDRRPRCRDADLPGRRKGAGATKYHGRSVQCREIHAVVAALVEILMMSALTPTVECVAAVKRKVSLPRPPVCRSLPSAADEDVVVGAAIERVVADAAVELIISGPASAGCRCPRRRTGCRRRRRRPEYRCRGRPGACRFRCRLAGCRCPPRRAGCRCWLRPLRDDRCRCRPSKRVVAVHPVDDVVPAPSVDRVIAVVAVELVDEVGAGADVIAGQGDRRQLEFPTRPPESGLV